MGARTKSRKRALDILFESEQRGINAVTLLEERIAVPVTQAPVNDYTQTLVRGVVEHWTVINEAIETYSRDWPLERMPAVDRALLRVAVWELVFGPDDVPESAAIAEAVGLARELSTDESPRFVNGLLSRIAEVKTTLV
ncbi:transcription antitermination factor NusB [Branchiibius cervicis]|uniref:Transcription antitermination protein NusB n=1 Tax=Branchiibius cervicis TaxID=908252 RepID=A0ABW2ASA4_9MICO